MRNRSGGGFGAAAGVTDVAGIFQANRQRAPKYDQLNATNIANRANERNAITAAEANTHCHWSERNVPDQGSRNRS